MLVFRRQQGESFMIGDAVEVRVLEISRNEVKIGVVAPQNIAIYRSEISEMNRRAAVEDPGHAEIRKAIAFLQKALKKPERS